MVPCPFFHSLNFPHLSSRSKLLIPVFICVLLQCQYLTHDWAVFLCQQVHPDYVIAIQVRGLPTVAIWLKKIRWKWSSRVLIVVYVCFSFCHFVTILLQMQSTPGFPCGGKYTAHECMVSSVIVDCIWCRWACVKSGLALVHSNSSLLHCWMDRIWALCEPIVFGQTLSHTSAGLLVQSRHYVCSHIWSPVTPVCMI